MSWLHAGCQASECFKLLGKPLFSTMLGPERKFLSFHLMLDINSVFLGLSFSVCGCWAGRFQLRIPCHIRKGKPGS